MLTFLFITVVGLSGLFSPLLRKSPEPMFENLSFSFNISETSKWKPSFIFTNLTAPIWKQGWRGGLDSSSKFKNISSKTVSEDNATLTTGSKWGMSGWSVFGKNNQMKWRQHFENFKGKFRSETRSSGAADRNVSVGASSPGSPHSRTSKVVNMTVGPFEADGAVSKAWTHVTTHTRMGERDGAASSNNHSKESVQKVRALEERVQNLTEAARSANQLAEKAENETEKLKLQVRRVEKELKLLARDAEARRKLRDQLTIKSADYEQALTRARRERTRAKNIGQELWREEAELEAARYRMV